MKEHLEQLSHAIDDVASDEEKAYEVPGEVIEKALSSLQEVPPDSALWRTIVTFVEGRQEETVRQHGGCRMLVKKLWQVPRSEALKAMEKKAMALGRPTKLFHGTAVENADKIVKNGFQVPHRHAHGGMFGKGIYFAGTPLKSMNYTHKEGKFSRFSGWLAGNSLSSGGLQMLLCDVYLGRSRTRRLGAWPDLDPDVDLKGGRFSKTFGLGDYQSLYVPGGLFGPVGITEYVVYNPEQAIPKLLIEFEMTTTWCAPQNPLLGAKTFEYFVLCFVFLLCALFILSTQSLHWLVCFVLVLLCFVLVLCALLCACVFVLA